MLLRSPYYTRPQNHLHSEILSVLKTSTLNQTAPAIDHPWSPSTVTYPYFLPRSYVQHHSARVIMNSGGFSSCNPDKPASIITGVKQVDMCRAFSWKIWFELICLYASSSVEYKYISTSNEKNDPLDSGPFGLWILILILFGFQSNTLSRFL